MIEWIQKVRDDMFAKPTMGTEAQKIAARGKLEVAAAAYEAVKADPTATKSAKVSAFRAYKNAKDAVAALQRRADYHPHG